MVGSAPVAESGATLFGASVRDDLVDSLTRILPEGWTVGFEEGSRDGSAPDLVIRRLTPACTRPLLWDMSLGSRPHRVEIVQLIGRERPFVTHEMHAELSRREHLRTHARNVARRAAQRAGTRWRAGTGLALPVVGETRRQSQAKQMDTIRTTTSEGEAGELPACHFGDSLAYAFRPCVVEVCDPVVARELRRILLDMENILTPYGLR